MTSFKRIADCQMPLSVIALLGMMANAIAHLAETRIADQSVHASKVEESRP